MMRAVVCVLYIAAISLALGQDGGSGAENETIPYCDEVDTHPSVGAVATEGLPPLPSSVGSSANDVIVGAADKVAEVSQITSELSNEEITKSVVRFEGAASQAMGQVASIHHGMVERQKDIDEIFGTILPALESAIISRRDRASVVRSAIASLNEKLATLVDSLDRSTYVQEQQVFMNIIDGLMRIQNTLEMRLVGGSTPYVPRATAQHPSHALLSIAQDTVAVPKQESTVANTESQELLDTLDLLEVESLTAQRESLPYERRANLVMKKMSSLLTRLIDKFSQLRQKHKEFARTNRELWSQEIDILQRQADDLAAILETVVDQAHFYIQTYEKHRSHLDALITAQHNDLTAYSVTKQKLTDMGADFHQASQLRATQLRKLSELQHYLTHGNQEYVESVYNFACDGIVDGTASVDACGVCGGGGSTCMDCSDEVNGTSEIDVCGMCGGEGRSCRYFCDGKPNSGRVMDLCGVCGGDSASCKGCDGIPNSGVEVDACGVCGGDGKSCSQAGGSH